MIQDNDFEKYLGESTFSNVQLVDTNPTSPSTSISRPFQAERDNNPASPRSHVNFGSLDVPHAQSPWTAAKSLFPLREDGWDVAYDVLEDPKDYCYFTEIETSGFNANNPKETNLNDFWKNLSGTVTPERVKSDGGRPSCL